MGVRPTLGDLRSSLAPRCRERDDHRAYRDLARDGLVYLVAFVGASVLPGPGGRVLSGVIAGLAVTALFVWAHDVAHGALLGDGRWPAIVGTMAMLPSLQPYRLWQHGHNRVHHGFTSLTSVDWIWRPWSPAEYAAASRTARIGYRIERSLTACGWHYLRRVWWDGMVRYRPANARQRADARFSWAVTGAGTSVLSATSWWLGGWSAVVTAVVVPWAVFTYAIALITYVHHTHPTRTFCASRSTWEPVLGHVTGSVVVVVPRAVGWLLHDILVHTPHHLDQRIPYYRLQAAWDQLRPAVTGLDVLEYRGSPRAIAGVFRRCKLFDYEAGCWRRFPDRREALRPWTAPASSPMMSS